MKTNEIYTVSHGLVPVPNKWIIPGLKENKGNLDCYKFIIEMVCKAYNQTEKSVMAKTRKREFLKTRQIITSLIKNNFYKLTLADIGHRCGGKDHATVLHSCNAVQNSIDTNKVFKEEYELFDNIIKDNIKSFKQTHLKYKKGTFVE